MVRNHRFRVRISCSTVLTGDAEAVSASAAVDEPPAVSRPACISASSVPFEPPWTSALA